MNYFITSLILFVSCALSAQVVEAPNLDLIRKESETLDQNALVVFDVDWTLIVHQDKVLAPCGRAFSKRWKQDALAELGAEKISHLASIVLLHSKYVLINSDVVSLINNLKAKNIKVIGLTAVESGPFGIIPNMEDWRLHQLDQLGISFRQAFPQIVPFALNQCQGQRCPAVFKEGILFSGKYTKGEVLAAFLDTMAWRPSKIIFIDDLLPFIDTVESHCEKLQIPVVSFHYTEALNLPGSFDERLGLFQWNYLKEKSVWLSDEEARAFLNDSCSSCSSK